MIRIKPKMEKDLRKLWKMVRDKKSPYPHMAEDIEEFLKSGEWNLAFEHILDWAAAEKKLDKVNQQVELIRMQMIKLSSK